MLENSFTNPPVPIAQLPTILTLDNQRLSAQYVRLNRLLNLTFTLLVCLLGVTLYYQNFVGLPYALHRFLPYSIWAAALLGFLFTCYSYASDKVKFYALRALDLHYTSGLFFRKVISQPITRIQHIELKSGPIERKVGLARLQVFSAGGEMHTLQIPGLPLETAQQLRQFMLQHKDLVKHG